MKESSLRNLKQKIQRNEITSIAGRSAMTMPGPTVNMITTNEVRVRNFDFKTVYVSSLLFLRVEAMVQGSLYLTKLVILINES